MADPLQRPKDRKRSSLSEKIGKHADLKQRGREDRRRSDWFGLGMFGLVGWSVAVPSVLGIMLGIWLDRRWPGHVSWTLTFLLIGVGLGCLNAWYWIKQETGHD
jgi:ATP synthase protein I